MCEKSPGEKGGGDLFHLQCSPYHSSPLNMNTPDNVTSSPPADDIYVPHDWSVDYLFHRNSREEILYTYVGIEDLQRQKSECDESLTELAADAKSGNVMAYIIHQIICIISDISYCSSPYTLIRLYLLKSN